MTDNRPEIEDELDIDFTESEVDSSPSKVAKSAKKNFVLLAVIIIVSTFIFYYIVFGGKTVEKPLTPDISNKVVTIKPTITENDVKPALPALPSPPPLEVPKPPEPIVTIAPQAPVLPLNIQQPVLAAPVIATQPQNNEDQFKAAMEARKKSGIMLVGGKGDSANANDKSVLQNTQYLETDAYFSPSKTPAPQQKATIGKPDSVIAQGKIIDAIIETALNTDFAGTTRAIVTRDVYAEAGKNILIPKGSRLIGTYPSTVKAGQNRVAILWNRLIRPDGIDLIIDSPGVDKLGRAGVEGVLDNKYLETIGNAILLSSLNIGFAVGADKLTNAQAQTTTSISGPTGAVTTTTTGKSSDSATQQAVTNVQDASKNVVKDSQQATATITIDQGIQVKVFVNKDLIFPAHMVGNSARILTQ